MLSLPEFDTKYAVPEQFVPVGVGEGVGVGVGFTPVPLRVTAGTAVAEFVLKDNVPEYALTAIGENVTL